MAIYTVVYFLEDSEQRKTKHTVLFDSADESALLTAAAAHQTDLAAMTELGVDKYTYTREVSVGSAAGAGSNIDTGLTVTWNSALTIDPTTKVPGPVMTIFDGEGRLDTADATVTAWADNYLSGEARVNKNSPTQPTSIRRGKLDK